MRKFNKRKDTLFRRIDALLANDDVFNTFKLIVKATCSGCEKPFARFDLQNLRVVRRIKVIVLRI